MSIARKYDTIVHTSIDVYGHIVFGDDALMLGVSYLAGEVENFYLGADEGEGFCEGVDVVEAWFDCSKVPAELLIHSLVALIDDFVGVVDTAAENARNPCSQASTAFSPYIHALSVARYIFFFRIFLWKVDVLRFRFHHVKAFLHCVLNNILYSNF